MSKAIRFTEERRNEWLKMLSEGKTQREANESLGVSKATIAHWMKTGKAKTAGPHFEFVQAYEQIPRPRRRSRPSELVSQERAGGLSVEQLVGLLEGAAIDGNVQAMKYLLDRPWERKDEPEEVKPVEETVFDQLAALRERKAGA
jgi:IS30 family transposase